MNDIDYELLVHIGSYFLRCSMCFCEGILGDLKTISSLLPETQYALIVVVVQLLSHVQLFAPHEQQHARFPILHYVPEFVQTHVR